MKASIGKMVTFNNTSSAQSLQKLYEMHDRAFKAFIPKPYSGRVAVIRTSRQPRGIQPDSALGWSDTLTGNVELQEVPGHYINIFVEPSVSYLAETLQECMRRSVQFSTISH